MPCPPRRLPPGGSFAGARDMEVLRTKLELRSRRAAARSAARPVGLVPTMGFLHQGHLALVRRAAELADEVWVSVFVNPTQFGPQEDLARYPRDLGRDLELLASEGTAVVFAPEAVEVYPRPAAVKISFPGMDDVLEGEHRPGHFAGVALVVAKLFHLIEPDVAVFGQKDGQQALLVRRLVEDLDLPVRVDVAATVREPDGLAMSSRNVYLSADQRAAAPAIFRALERGAAAVRDGETDPGRVEAVMAAVVDGAPPLELEYARCVDHDSLATPGPIERQVMLAIAARAGSTRLIDNVLVDPSDDEGK